MKKTDIVNICLGTIEELRMKYPERTIEFSAKGKTRNISNASANGHAAASALNNICTTHEIG